MVKQIVVFNSSEAIEAILSVDLPDACPVISPVRTMKSAESGGYSDTFAFTVPSNHADSAFIAENSFIGFIDEDGFFQIYKVTNISLMDSDGQTYRIASCEHQFYELIGETISDIRPTNTLASAALVQALSGTRWSIGIVDDFPVNSTRIYETSVLSGLIQIAGVWGGELRFRTQLTGGVISGRYVDLLTRRGADTGKRFERNKDLVEVDYTRNIQGLCTALIGRGKGVEIDSEDSDTTYGRRLKFTDTVWTTPTNPTDKPAGQDWIGDDDAKTLYGTAGGTRHITHYVNFDDCEDVDELIQLTYDELQVRKVPKVTYSLRVVVLESLTGYSHEAVRLGDTVYVINTAVTPVIRGNARVIEINRNIVDPMDCNVVLGNFIPTAQKWIANIKKTQDSMTDRQGSWDRAGSAIVATGSSGLQNQINLLKTQLISTTSGVSTDAQGNILFENSGKTAALKLGAGIFAIANTRLPDDSDYDWRQFGSGSGFTADEIVVGTLRSAVIFTGILSGTMGTFVDLIAGTANNQRMHMGYDAFGDPFFHVYDNTGALTFTINKRGMTFPNGADFQQYTYGTRTGIGIFAI